MPKQFLSRSLRRRERSFARSRAGSKFRAAASGSGLWGERDIAEEAARIDQRIAGYLADLNVTDATEK